MTNASATQIIDPPLENFKSHQGWLSKLIAIKLAFPPRLTYAFERLYRSSLSKSDSANPSSGAYLRPAQKREGRQARRLYRTTPAGRKALAAAKIKVRELVGELFED